MNQKGNALLMVMVLVAALTIAIPYVFQSTTQMARMTGHLRARFTSRSIANSAIGLAEDLLRRDYLVLDPNNPWKLSLDPARTPTTDAFWEFREGTATNPSVLTVFSCDPDRAHPHGVPPQEEDCAVELTGYVVTISFIGLAENCDYLIAKVESIYSGVGNEIDKYLNVTTFETGKTC